MSKKLKILLSVSIILNILFIGMLIGHFSQRFSMQRFMKGDVIETIKSLPQDKQELVFNTIKQVKIETKGRREQIQKNRIEILETLTAPEFNPELFDKQVKELHATFEELTIELGDAVKKLALNLNQKERQALAEMIVKQHRSRRFGGNWNHSWYNEAEESHLGGSAKEYAQ